MDFEGTRKDFPTIELLKDLNKVCVRVQLMDAKTVPWFPQTLSDLDYCVQETLDAGADLESDHPGFNDEEYRERRKFIADWAYSFKMETLFPGSTTRTPKRPPGVLFIASCRASFQNTPAKNTCGYCRF